MAQNEIEEMLDHLRRIKSGGNLDSVKINRIEKLEMVLKYHHVLLPDSLVKLTEKAKWIVEMLQWVLDGIPDECKTNLNLRRLESYLLEFIEEINGYVNHEKMECLETRIQFMANNVGQLYLAVSVILVSDFVDDTDEDEVDTYEYYLFDKPPYVLFLIVLVELEMKKIFLSELKDSKFTQSRTFKDKKLPKEFFHHLHSLLMYLRNKKLRELS
ncbi:hypothetical protein KY289_036809 [Solanum tuberosum]|nr:hypothetical protein KY284_036628 [Solanum tuberosum]KAH0636894.1 hypothetical protein KY289_036809 [Solanum tuberosum]